MAEPFKFDPEDHSKPSSPDGFAHQAQWPEPQPLEDYLFPVLPMSKEMLPDALLIGRMMSVIECAVHSTSPPSAPSS